MSAPKEIQESSGSPIMRNRSLATSCSSSCRPLAKHSKKARRLQRSKASRPPPRSMRQLRVKLSRSIVLSESPALVNEDPTGEGWFFKIKLTEPAELNGLMDEDAYREFVKTLS